MGIRSETDSHQDGAVTQDASANSVQMADLFVSLITSTSADVVFVQDRTLRYIYICNPAQPLTCDEVLGKTDWEMLPASEAKRLTDIKLRVLASGEPHREMLSLSPGGIVRWYDVIYTPVRDRNGAITAVASYARDVTDYKQAEQSLRMSEARYRTLLDSLDSMLIVTDRQGRLRYVNNVATSQLGQERSALIGRRLDEFFPIPFSAEHLDGFRRVVASDQRVSFENRLLLDGWLRWHRITMQPIHDEHGAIEEVLINAADIHDIKIAQQSLQRMNESLETRVQERTAELRDLYDRAPIGYHVLDADGCIEMINQTELNWLGYTRNEMVGRLFSDFLAAESRAVFARNLAVLKERGHANELEYDAVRKDGTLFPIVVHDVALYDADGGLRATRSAVFDATERRQAQEQLHFQSSLLTAVAQAVIVTGPDGRIIYWNAAAEALYGWTRDEVMGRQIEEITVPVIAQAQADEIMAALRAGNNWAGEFPVRRRDGSTFWAMVLDTPIRDMYGQVIGIIGISTDVSARKQAEQALVESERQNRLLFEESPDALLVLDENGRILRANYAFETLVKAPAVTMVGRAASELPFASVAARQHLCDTVGRLFAETSDPAASVSLEYELTDQEGTTRVVESTFFPLLIRNTRQVLVTSRDVTSRRQVEEAKRLAALELQRALALKNQFLATMSHELRTPLNSILTMSHLLQEEVATALDSRQQRLLSTIVSSSQQLRSLIDDLLDLSKIEANLLELTMQPVRLDDVCRASLLFIQESAFKKQIAVSYTNAWPDEMVEADPRRLKQMLVSLLDNALKFTPDGGAVSLTVRVEAAAQQVSFAVQDNGIAIPPAVIPKLFEPFMQLDASLARQYEGAGLGLALVKRLAERHGGAISVESSGVSGEGSCFTIVLPLYQDALAASR